MVFLCNFKIFFIIFIFFKKKLSEFKFGSLCVNKKRLNDKMMSKVKGTRNISVKP